MSILTFNYEFYRKKAFLKNRSASKYLISYLITGFMYWNKKKLPNSCDKTRFSNRRRSVSHAEYRRARLSLAWAHLELVSKSLQQNNRTSSVFCATSMSSIPSISTTYSRWSSVVSWNLRPESPWKDGKWKFTLFNYSFIEWNVPGLHNEEDIKKLAGKIRDSGQRRTTQDTH